MARALRRATVFSSFVRNEIAGASPDPPSKPRCTCAEAAFGTRSGSQSCVIVIDMFLVIYRLPGLAPMCGWRGRAFCLTSLLVLSGGANLAAQTQNQQTPHFSVSVTERTDIVEEVGTTRRILKEEIETQQARTLDEALRLLPGVYVRTGGQGMPRIDLRGWRSRHVLLLVDGVPVNSTDDGQFDPTEISMASIREIKVTYGASSLLYGENAVAGVIEISTEPVQPGRSAAVDLDIRRGIQGQAGGHVSLGTERVSVLVSGNSFNSDGFRLPGTFMATSTEDGGLRANSDRVRQTALVKVGVTASRTLKLGGQVTVGGGSHGLPPTTIDSPDDPFAQRIRYERVEHYRSARGQVSAEYRPASSFQLRAWAFVNNRNEDRVRYDDATYSSFDDPLVSGTFQRTDETTISGGAVHGLADFGAVGRLRFSLNTRHESLDSTGQVRDQRLGGGGGGGRGAGSTIQRFALRAFDEHRQVGVHAVGAEWEVRPTPRTGLVAGMSGTWQNRPEGRQGGASWLLGVSRQLTDELAARAAVTRRLRVPSIRQLYEAETGNPALVPERSSGVEIGLDQRWRAERVLSLAGFLTWADEYIERDSQSPFANRDEYRFAGVETTFETRDWSPLDLRLGYSWMHAVDQSPGTERDTLPYRPRHRVTVDTRWTLPGQWRARAALYHAADVVYYSRRAPLIRADASSYRLVDVSLTRALSDAWDVTVSVNNLFDELYEESYGLPREGRTVLLRLLGRL